MEDSLAKLHEHMNRLPVGKVADAHVKALTGFLVECWYLFTGANEASMAAWKLWDRPYDVTWNPPALKFTIDRHGSAALGSKYAERCRMKVDLVHLKVDCFLQTPQADSAAG